MRQIPIAQLGALDFGTAETPVSAHPAANLEVSGSGQLCFFDDQTVANVSGAGSYTGFTGTIMGTGRLLLGEGQTLGLDASQVTSNVGFENDTLVVSAATRTVPLVRTSGRVILPKNGTLKLADAASASFGGKRFQIAECAAADIPSDLSGWTLEPASEQTKLTFKFENGKLFVVCSGGTLVTIR